MEERDRRKIGERKNERKEGRKGRRKKITAVDSMFRHLFLFSFFLFISFNSLYKVSKVGPEGSLFDSYYTKV